MLDANQLSPGTEASLPFKENIAKHPLIIVLLELLLALPLGFILAELRVGGIAWIFGGIGSGALLLNAYRIIYKDSLKSNKNVRKTGQILVGLTIGFSISHGNLKDIIPELPLYAFLTLFILVCGTLIGYIYSQISKTNILNAMLATVPGGVGIMSSIAADYDRDATLVSLVQVIRVTSVVLIIPIAARVSAGSFSYPKVGLIQQLFDFDLHSLPFLFLALAMALLGVWLTNILQIPAAHFFGALIVGIGFNPLLNLLPFITDLDFNLPRLVSLVGQALLGISIGEYWGSSPNLDKKTIGYAFFPVVMNIAAGLLAAAIAMYLTSWDWLTCMLLTAPGGSAEMILVALALHHNVEIVTAGHLVRLIAIHASLPLWLLLFRRLDQLLPNSGDN